jgi:hypothetical protein
LFRDFVEQWSQSRVYIVCPTFADDATEQFVSLLLG